jgi:hypothetical protein
VHHSINEKKVIITIWPNCDDNNHVLIITIDVDSRGDGQEDLLLILEKMTKRWVCVCHVAGL